MEKKVQKGQGLSETTSNIFIWSRKSNTTEHACLRAQSLNHIQPFVTPQTVAYQASLSTGLPRQEYWSGLPIPFPLPLLRRTQSHHEDSTRMTSSKPNYLPKSLSSNIIPLGVEVGLQHTFGGGTQGFRPSITALPFKSLLWILRNWSSYIHCFCSPWCLATFSLLWVQQQGPPAMLSEHLERVHERAEKPFPSAQASPDSPWPFFSAHANANWLPEPQQGYLQHPTIL